MNRTQRAATCRLLAAWRQILVNANHVAAEADPDDLGLLEGVAEVRDYIMGQIEICEARLTSSAVPS